MARKTRKWEEDWSSSSWASARGLWKRPSPEEEEVDDRSWCAAACESGGLFGVLWCELCQLLGDLVPHGIRARLSSRPRMTRMARPSRKNASPAPEVLHSPAPEQAEG